VSHEQSPPAPDPVEVAQPLPNLVAVFWIGFFSFREMVRRRRLVFLGLVMLLPVVLTLLWRLLDREGMVTPSLLLANLGGTIYVHFLVALVSMAVGLSAIGEQLSEGVIIYYWTRPLQRSAIYLGRLLAAQAVAAVLLVSSLAACFLVIVTGNTGALTLDFLELYLGNCLIVVIGGLVYTAVFAAVGTWLRRPVLPAVLFAFGWEFISGHFVPLRIKKLTVVFHLRNLIQNATPDSQDVPNLLLRLKETLFGVEVVPEWQSALTLLLVMMVATVAGIWLLSRKEIFQ